MENLLHLDSGADDCLYLSAVKVNKIIYYFAKADGSERNFLLGELNQSSVLVELLKPEEQLCSHPKVAKHSQTKNRREERVAEAQSAVGATMGHEDQQASGHAGRCRP